MMLQINKYIDQDYHIFKLVFILVFLVISGCATTDTTRTRMEGTAAGVVAGAATGAAVGAVAGAIAGDAGTGAMIGAGVGSIVGGIAGYFYGDSVASDKVAYTQHENNLRLAMVDIDQNLKITKEYNTQLAQEISSLQEHKKALVFAGMKKTTLKNALRQQKSKTLQLLAKSEKQLTSLKTKILKHKSLIANEEKLTNSPEKFQQSVTLVKANINGLETEQQTLQSYINQLKQIDRRRVY
jgi:hypothetical protein